MERVAWTAHPARERPRDLALVACVLFLTLGATLVAFNSMLLAVIAAFIVIIGVSPFLFPTRYCISDWGVEAKGLLRTRARRWSDLRRFEVGRGAALVSPLLTPSWLDRYRGMILMLEGVDRDKVLAALTEQLGPDMPAESKDGAAEDEASDTSDTSDTNESAGAGGSADQEDTDGTL